MNMTEFNPKINKKQFWIRELKTFIPEFLKKHSILKNFHENASIMLHGSITLGFDDPYSDLDLWFLIPEEELAELERVSESLFFEIEVKDKPGHLNAESIEDISRRFLQLRNHYGQHDMDIVFQLRNAEIVIDKTAIGNKLINSACQPMKKKVSDVFFFYHYIEMRGEHRACDNPMERQDPVAILLSLPKTIAHALRAAMVLDGEPYPYDKWLYYTASQTPTGRKIVPSVSKILDLIAKDNLRFKGSELENPISQELRVIRKILIESAHSKGNFSPWLEKWWLYMTQALDQIKEIHW
jgi:predicted nucleotidyltransferase